jgi:NAD-dependent DNA ligase
VFTLQNFFSASHTLELLRQLERVGIRFSAVREVKEKKEKRATFAITGTFPFSRDKIKELMVQQGYGFHGKPTERTDFLLVGEKAGAKKLQQAEGLTMYEGRETLLREFPFLKSLEVNAPKVVASVRNVQERLF